ncbi:hypothetical protein LWM68_31010 [Niabella sp. W65]|nr:hypothetical protein [Niabella sp. W65]MCH7366806.1 hypothetical protein [Niabella sp. W65]
MINGAWETVYRPAIACNTRWDYVCGSEINISITDPRVTPNCGPALSGEAVWIRSIGNFSVRDVLQTSNNAPVQGCLLKEKVCLDMALIIAHPLPLRLQVLG